MKFSPVIFLLITLVSCNTILFESSSMRAKSFSAPQLAEDTEGTISISNPDHATVCEITESTNVTITQPCSCSQNSCTLKVQGTSDFYGAASLKYVLSRGDMVSLPAIISVEITSVFNLSGTLDLSNVASSTQARRVSFSSLTVDEDIQKVEVCLSSTAVANCDVQGWMDVTTATSASGQTTGTWTPYHLKTGTHGAVFTLQESCLAPEDYFLKVRLTNVTNETSIVSATFGAWSPNCLSALSLWLDADDASTFTLVGSDVSEWRDKSSAANHALQPSAVNRPVLGTNILNGQSVVRFPSNADTLTGTNAGSFQSIISVRNLLASSFQMLFSSPAHGDFSLRANGGFDGTSVLLYTGGPNMNDWTFGNANFWVNGTQTTTAMTNYHIVAASKTGVQNATYSVSSDFMGRGLDNNSGVAELIVLNNEFTTGERQKLEGYLAHKWDLSSLLPLAHPYKTTPP